MARYLNDNLNFKVIAAHAAMQHETAQHASAMEPTTLRIPQRLISPGSPTGAPACSPGSSDELHSPPGGSSRSSSSPSPHTTVSLATTVSVSSSRSPAVAASSWWHPHVYGRPPKRPTPHFIADILGLSSLQVSTPLSVVVTSTPTPGEEQPLNLTTKPRTETVKPVVLAQPNPLRRPFREPPLLNGHINNSDTVLPKPATQIKVT
ncbi:hypothetical protein B566_EDAN015035 [Ephemera danica]|nr:hypothetical protein B566_EDAN015035 [Ephemera danica]